jgi:hypothetical protein
LVDGGLSVHEIASMLEVDLVDLHRRLVRLRVVIDEEFVHHADGSPFGRGSSRGRSL